jgi:dTDP-4-dehydrorhamnose reductase
VEKKTILVTGATGQLGRELHAAVAALEAHSSKFSTRNSQIPTHSSELEARNSQLEAYNFIFADRSLLPIEDAEAVSRFFQKETPSWCINCAAYTAVDKAETEKELAFRVNASAVGNLAAACSRTGARLIHLSTDYVFDGNSATPLNEADPTAPVNTYGASKLKGEQEAFGLHPGGTLVIRTSWVYSEFGNNFVKTMIRLMKERPEIRVVNDQVGSPTYAADLANAILRIIGVVTSQPASFRPGIYNYSNEGEISWFEFARAIRDLTTSACEVKPIPSSEFPTPARRPHYSLLDKSLIRKTYGLTIPGWRESLTVCLSKLAASN